VALNFLNDGYFAGKVGIGTASPGARLDIRTNGQIVEELTLCKKEYILMK
jgi:hypothetical protein